MVLGEVEIELKRNFQLTRGSGSKSDRVRLTECCSCCGRPMLEYDSRFPRVSLLYGYFYIKRLISTQISGLRTLSIRFLLGPV